MRDILPDIVIRRLHDRYVAGVADAEAGFDMSEADEDSLTGALGQAISTPREEFFPINGENISVKIDYKKIRGRGGNAPEKHFGIDGIFQIAIKKPSGKVIRQKALPFQAKKNWTGKDKGLLDQVTTMEKAVLGGIVVDYTNHGYSACKASDVVGAQGNRRSKQLSGRVRSLGQILGSDF